ncbi:MAG: CPBP family intramembrane metalloprotease, partial [Caldilineaceae bacterium]|nr:CPBP family intramembrane metalloprotease [Caldilineaceae bacterium]
MNRQATLALHPSRSAAVRNIIIFTLLVNGLAWLGPVLGGDPTNPGIGFLLWGVAPIAAALLMKFLLRDKTPLGFRLYLRGNGRWYLLSLLLYPVAILTVLGMGWMTGAGTLNSFTLSALVMAAGPPVIIYFIFAFFEEVGWRGYLAPRVATVHDGLLGHALVGLIWASWHFPYMTELWAHTSEGLVTLLPRFILGTMISAVVYGEIRLRTGSLWPAVLMHWMGNTIANTLLAGLG